MTERNKNLPQDEPAKPLEDLELVKETFEDLSEAEEAEVKGGGLPTVITSFRTCAYSAQTCVRQQTQDPTLLK